MDRPDAHQQIMFATYRALSKHGYANLTMQNIADETSKSKSLLHYHYDTKQDLVAAFLDFLLEQLREQIRVIDAESAGDHLEELIDLLLLTDQEFRDKAPFTQGVTEFQTVLLELKTQAAHNPVYREKIREFDDLLHKEVTDVVEKGRDSGEFSDINSEEVTALLLSAVDGTLNREATLRDGDAVEVGRRVLKRHVVDEVLRGDPKH